MGTSRQIEAAAAVHPPSPAVQGGTNEWRNRVVVVTGGSSGIGRAFVGRLAAAGARVVACGRNQASLQELQTRHPTIEALRCDITMRQEVLALVSAVQDRHGCLDTLINNAGVMEQVDLLGESVSDDRIAYEIGVNLIGTILLTRRFLPLLRASRDPIIVMISSGYALIPATRAPTYSASKAGLHAFTMALRRQLRGIGIRVVEVLPPLIDTPATCAVKGAKMSADVLVDRVLRDLRLGRDEILPGKVGLLPILLRVIPSYVARRVAAT
jgi:uncharacterized oxidoreductase